MTHPAADRGSASLWVLTAAALVLAIAVAAQVRTCAVLARHRTETAADLAALAAAGHIGVDGTGCGAAAGVAAANGARLVRCVLRLDASGRSGEVTVGVVATVRFAGIGARTIGASARAGRPP